MIKRTLQILCFVFLLMGCSTTKEITKIKLDKQLYDSGEFIDIESNDLINSKYKNYILYVHNNFCSLPIPCQNIFKEYMEKYKVSFLSINIDEYKKTKLYEKVKYAPTIIIVSSNDILDYLNAESNSDLDKYQDINEFEKWVNKYVELQ